ncbi:MAG: hypothetical protein AAFV53_19240 [Myxococcota bacterium]
MSDGSDTTQTPLAQLVRRCQMALAAGQTDEALQLGAQAVKTDPDAPAGWQQLAAALVTARRWRQLAMLMGRAHPRFPDAAWVWEHLIYAALGQGDADDAVRIGTAAVREHPRTAAVWHALGLAHWQRGDLRGALLAADAIRRYDGDELNAQLLELRVLAAKGADDEVIARSQAILARRPGLAEVLQHDATARLRSGQPATQSARRLVEINGDMAGHWVVLGAAEANAGAFKRAARAQSQAAARAPDAPGVWQAWLVYLLADGAHEDAFAVAGRALQRHPDAAPLWYLGALAALGRDRLRDALAANRVARRLSAAVPALEVAQPAAEDMRVITQLIEPIAPEHPETLQQAARTIFGDPQPSNASIV